MKTFEEREGKMRGGVPACLLFLLALTGCAMNQPIAQKLARPAAAIAIPVACIDKVVHAVPDKTRCEALPKKSVNAPDQAECSHVIVQYHCTKAVKP
jgi:hypothetical protein